jgi:hypothetical protein
MEYKPPALHHDPAIATTCVPHLFIYDILASYAKKPELYLAIYGCEIYCESNDKYVTRNGTYDHDELNLGLYMPIECIKLRLIEKEYKRRWYTISLDIKAIAPVNKSRYCLAMNNSNKVFLDRNRDVMDYMFRVLPQPIAEELFHYVFW